MQLLQCLSQLAKPGEAVVLALPACHVVHHRLESGVASIPLKLEEKKALGFHRTKEPRDLRHEGHQCLRLGRRGGCGVRPHQCIVDNLLQLVVEAKLGVFPSEHRTREL